MRLKSIIAMLLAFLILLPLCCPVLAEDSAAVQETEETEINTQVRHYLVLGQDTYDEGIQEDSRTDTILLVSLDSKYRRIIMTSIMRDSKVTTPKGNETKINTIYKFYGLDGIVSTVESHLEIDIAGAVLINYETVKELIDALGGVDIEIDINECIQISSILLHNDPNLPEGPGMTHMTGRIALAYMRDRSSGSGDFSRTQRQRNVINELLRKCREMTLADLSAVYNAISQSDGIDTDMNALELLSAFQQGYALLDGTFIENNIPDSHTYSYGTLRGSSVLNVKWNKNRDLLHALLNSPAEEE